MAGKNKNYTLGKGRVYFERFAANQLAATGVEEYLSQTPEFSYNVKATVLDHYDSDQGLKELDEEVTTQVDVTGKFNSDDMSMEKVALFLLANAVTETTITSGTGLSDTFASVKPGQFLQLGRTNGQPTGARNVTVTKVATVLAPTTALALNTDYTVDGPLGRVQMTDATTAIDTDGSDGIIVTYSITAGIREQVVSADSQVRGALRFVADNPVGDNRDFYFPLVNLTPDGDYALKGDDWQKMGFNFTTLKLGALERVYVDGRPAA